VEPAPTLADAADDAMTLRWTDADYAAYVQAKTKPAERKARVDYVPYRERKRGMNGLETAFAASLEAKRRAGVIRWWAFEPIRIKLAEATYYKPDFLTVDAEGHTEVFETKGLMREAARVRLNVAASKLPWPFWLVKKCGDGFTVKRISDELAHVEQST